MAQWEERLGMQEGRMVLFHLVSNCLQVALLPSVIGWLKR